MHFMLNGVPETIPADWAGESLLYLLREHFGLVGAKFGCGVGACGACTVIVDDAAVRACVTLASDVVDSAVRTVEGLAAGDALHPVQRAWLAVSAPQCGYCQAGQIMSAVALLERNPRPSAEEIEAAMDGNLCRCGAYPRIRAAVARAAEGA